LSQIRRCFIAIAFKLAFSVCHQEGPSKSGRTGTEWNTTASGLHCGYENWSLTLREEARREENWRRLHNEELHISYAAPNIIRVIKARKMRWVSHVPRMG
jgi:hypothetical protein